jgi:Amt family ammonium transporter
MPIDTGDTAWLLASTALVMIMTPAVGFFYGGLVRAKNLVSTIVQCLTIFAVVSIVWALWGYSLAFGPGASGYVGDLSVLGLNGVTAEPNTTYSKTIPELVFFAFQLKFAAITPALIIGALVERVRFKALLIFIILWATLIYAPIAYWVWNPNGWLRVLGAVDFAGGLVVHLSSGVSAAAAALAIGRRVGVDRSMSPRPNNVPYVILGAAILWFGWFGFNAGSSLAADGIAAAALVNTNMAGATAAVAWMMVDWWRRGKPSAVGISVGAICGLAAVTPAAGFVGVLPAMFIGLIAGIVCNLVSNWRLRSRLDDSLDVFACHGVGGMWGTIATGLFATTMINAVGPNGLFFGNPMQVGVQVAAVLVVAAFAFVGSFVLIKVINLFTRVRVTEEDETSGLDMSQHGEEAYADS